MKRKRILVLVAIIVVLVALVVVLTSVYSVRRVMPVYHNFDGGIIQAPDNAPTADDILSLAKGKSTVFLMKNDLTEMLNKQFPQWHAFAVVKHSPDLLEVHFVKRQAVLKVLVGGASVYLDSFGYVVDAPKDHDCIDVTSAFKTTVSSATVPGVKFEFAGAEENEKLSSVINALMSLWQCKIEFSDAKEILGTSDVFEFGDDGDMVINTLMGAKIIVKNPKDNLNDRLINAFSVYYSNNDLQQAGRIIVVQKNGQITTDK